MCSIRPAFLLYGAKILRLREEVRFSEKKKGMHRIGTPPYGVDF